MTGIVIYGAIINNKYRTGPPASRRTRPSPVERRGRRYRRSSRRLRVERLPLLRRAYDHHRDLPTRLPTAAVANSIDRARQLMTITPLSPSPSSLPPDAALSPAPATPRRQRPSAPSSPGKTRSIEYQITRPILPRAAKTSATAGHSTVVLSGTDRSDQAAAANSP